MFSGLILIAFATCNHPKVNLPDQVKPGDKEQVTYWQRYNQLWGVIIIYVFLFAAGWTMLVNVNSRLAGSIIALGVSVLFTIVELNLIGRSLKNNEQAVTQMSWTAWLRATAPGIATVISGVLALSEVFPSSAS